MLTLDQLPLKKQELLLQALADFDARWDESVSLLHAREDGVHYYSTRASVYYALALLVRQRPGDVDRADRILRKVLDMQFLCPGQLWHGTFAASLDQPLPVQAPWDIAGLTPEARWQGDALWEKLMAAFRYRLESQPKLAQHHGEITSLLSASLRDVYPVVWETYDPNWREFILATMALILEEFEEYLPEDTVSAMDAAAREALVGARFRAESGLTPMNTNVEVMHVFIFDAFSRRFQDAELDAYARDYAARFTEEYLRLHAVAEFNSPTYNGVVLSVTGLLRARGGSPEVRAMGETLEAGLWADLADFYNPALGTLCGPFSRAYGMTIEGTALPPLMYLGLEQIPEEDAPPFGPETETAGILCCTDVKILEEVKPRLLSFTGERRVTKQFRELAERGEPGQNHSLCTATAWISENLMLGALSGSTNTSHQLHALTAHWRNLEGSVSGLRLRRRTKDGIMHLRTVLFNMSAEKDLIFGTVRNDTTETVICNFEIESPHAAEGIYTENTWQVDGLRCEPMLWISANGQPERMVTAIPEIRSQDNVWLNVSLNPGETLRVELHFSLEQ